MQDHETQDRVGFLKAFGSVDHPELSETSEATFSSLSGVSISSMKPYSELGFPQCRKTLRWPLARELVPPQKLSTPPHLTARSTTRVKSQNNTTGHVLEMKGRRDYTLKDLQGFAISKSHRIDQLLYKQEFIDIYHYHRTQDLMPWQGPKSVRQTHWVDLKTWRK